MKKILFIGLAISLFALISFNKASAQVATSQIKLAYTINKAGDDCSLNWDAWIFEPNVSFRIQASTDSLNWGTVGNVDCINFTGDSTHYIPDFGCYIIEGNNYIRIAEIDTAGRALLYSNVVNAYVTPIPPSTISAFAAVLNGDNIPELTCASNIYQPNGVILFQYSLNNSLWKDIEQIPSEFTSGDSLGHYTSLDMVSPGGLVYYRAQVIDKINKRVYVSSEVLSLTSPVRTSNEKLNSDLKIGLWPNPAQENFNLSVGGDYTWSIYNESGILIKQGYAANTTQIQANLKNGLYFVRVMAANNQTKIIKLLIKK